MDKISLKNFQLIYPEIPYEIIRWAVASQLLRAVIDEDNVVWLIADYNLDQFKEHWRSINPEQTSVRKNMTYIGMINKIACFQQRNKLKPYYYCQTPDGIWYRFQDWEKVESFCKQQQHYLQLRPRSKSETKTLFMSIEDIQYLMSIVPDTPKNKTLLKRFRNLESKKVERKRKEKVKK